MTLQGANCQINNIIDHFTETWAWLSLSENGQEKTEKENGRKDSFTLK